METSVPVSCFFERTVPVSCVRLKAVKAKEEREYFRIIMAIKFRSVLLAFQKGLHKAKKVLTSHREDENRREWAKLNIELLHLISKKMESILNLIHFRAVCKDWRLATDPTDAPAQLPWLIWSTVSDTIQLAKTRRKMPDNEYFVYSFSSRATQRIRFPVNNVLLGTSAGYVLVHERPSSIYFLNLLTGAKVALSFLNPSFYYRISCLGHGSSHNSNIVGTEIFLLISREQYADETIKFQFIRFRPPNTIKCISNIILSRAAVFGYYKGMIFVSIGVNEVTCAYDASTGTKTSIEIPLPPWISFNFLIDAMGDLLGVWMHYGTRYQFYVYRLEHTDDFGCCQWTRINGIGDRILFLQDYKYGFCVRANDLKGLIGNNIYFKKIQHSYNGFKHFSGCLSRYDMETGIIVDLVWKSPDALWFMPSLC